MEVEVSAVNTAVNNIGTYSEDLDGEYHNRIQDAAEAVAELVDGLAETWESLGLSGREAEVAAYKQLGFTNRATA